MSDDDGTVAEARETRAIGRGMLYLFWLVALALLTWAGGRWLDAQHNPNSEPASRVAGGVREVILERNRYGHYVASGEINGQPVVMMLDTGATHVAVPARLAPALGLQKLVPVRVSTANGYADAWLTRIEELRIGNIVIRNLRASINPGMNHDEGVLLGMSALKNIEFAQKDDRLLLRQR